MKWKAIIWAEGKPDIGWTGTIEARSMQAALTVAQNYAKTVKLFENDVPVILRVEGPVMS